MSPSIKLVERIHTKDFEEQVNRAAHEVIRSLDQLVFEESKPHYANHDFDTQALDKLQWLSPKIILN